MSYLKFFLCLLVLSRCMDSWGQDKYEPFTPNEDTSNAHIKFTWNLAHQPTNDNKHLPPLVTYKGKQVYNLETFVHYWRNNTPAKHILIHIGIESTPASVDGSTGVLTTNSTILNDNQKKALINANIALDIDRIFMRIVVPEGIASIPNNSNQYPQGWRITPFVNKKYFDDQLPRGNIITENYSIAPENTWNPNTHTLYLNTDRRYLNTGLRNDTRIDQNNSNTVVNSMSTWILFAVDPNIRYINSQWKFYVEVKTPILEKNGNNTVVNGYKTPHFTIGEVSQPFILDLIRPTIDTNNPTRPYTGTRGVRIRPISTTAQDTDQDGAIIPGGVETTDMEGYRLPPGLTINQQTQQIEGVPTQSGTFRVRLKTIDVNGNTPENDPYREFTIKIYNFVPINSHIRISPQRQP